MKIKNNTLPIFGIIIILTTILSSCSTSDKVATSNLVQKRKYNNGWFVKQSIKTPKTKVHEENFEYSIVSINGNIQENSSGKTNKIHESKNEINNFTTSNDNSFIQLQNNTPVLFSNDYRTPKKKNAQSKKEELEECDIITLKNGEEIKAKVLEIGEESIKYKMCGKSDGPTYTKSKADVLFIKYPDGTKDIFNDVKTIKTEKPKENVAKKSIKGWGIAGTILGLLIPFIGWILGGIGLSIYKSNREMYTEDSRTWAIVAIVVSTIAFLIYLLILL